VYSDRSLPTRFVCQRSHEPEGVSYVSRTLPGVSSAGKRCLRAGMQGESPPRSRPCGCTVGKIRRFHPRRRHSAGERPVSEHASPVPLSPCFPPPSRARVAPVLGPAVCASIEPELFGHGPLPAKVRPRVHPGRPGAPRFARRSAFSRGLPQRGAVQRTRTEGTGKCRTSKSGATSRPYEAKRRVPSVRHPALRRSQAAGCSCR
jgi:hypothetical protein